MSKVWINIGNVLIISLLTVGLLDASLGVDLDEDALLEELSEEPTGKVLCKICGRTYSKKTNGRRHIKDAHTAGENVECQICGKQYSNRRYRNDHYRTAHKIKIKEMPPLIWYIVVIATAALAKDFRIVFKSYVVL